MAGRKICSEHEARECLAAVASSGMTRAAWARRHGFDGRSLNMWRLNLERRAPQPAGLRVVELVASAPIVCERERELRVRCGPFVVEVGGDFDDETLARVLTVVASC